MPMMDLISPALLLERFKPLVSRADKDLFG